MNLASPILVVGATGATGRHVVQQLLDQGRQVKVIVRSKERMLSMVDTKADTNLIVTEASLLDLSDDDLLAQVKDTEAVVCCLGHNLDFKGIFGHPRRLVRDSVQRLTTAMMQCKDGDKPKKIVVMGTVGVADPAGTDDIRGFWGRLLLSIFRYALPPHTDNEDTAAYIYSLGKDSGIEWIVVRPTDLLDGPVSEYTFYDKPQGQLFGDGNTTRSNVAKSMVDLLTDKQLWDTYKFRMPTVYDTGSTKRSESKKES